MAAKPAAPAVSPLDSPAHRAAVEKFKAIEGKKNADATGAIAILERRTATATEPVELPGGDVIQIRSRISRTEMAECTRLFQEIGTAHGTGDIAAVTRASNELIGHVLYDEERTPAEIAAWLDENPQAFSDIDAAEIMIAFGRMIVADKDRQERIASFRAQ